jgi:hypothetical protein
MSVTSQHVEWGDPPGDKRFSTDSARIAAQLKERPEVWAKVRTADKESTAASYAATIRLGRTPAFQPAGTFEAVRREGGVWARYVGEQS